MKFKTVTNGHFYAASIAEWRTDTDVEKLIKFMRKGKFNFTLIHVPLPLDSEYKIEFFVPVVEGCTKLAEYIMEE